MKDIWIPSRHYGLLEVQYIENSVFRHDIKLTTVVAVVASNLLADEINHSVECACNFHLGILVFQDQFSRRGAGARKLTLTPLLLALFLTRRSTIPWKQIWRLSNTSKWKKPWCLAQMSSESRTICARLR